MASLNIATNTVEAFDEDGDSYYTETWIAYLDGKVVGSGEADYRDQAVRLALFATMRSLGVDVNVCSMNSIPEDEEEDW